MIRWAKQIIQTGSRRHAAVELPREEIARAHSSGTPRSAYGAPFWFAYAANTTVMIAISLLFRYADFVAYLGGTEFVLGWIVGVGMVGSLVMRFFQGVGIDRYGARRIWLWSVAGMVISCLGHLLIGRPDGPAIFAMRVLYNTSIAGVFGASITYVSSRAPADRMAEVIGMLGTSGFVGMVIGPRLSDWLLATAASGRAPLDRMFMVAAGLCVVSWCFAALATRGYAQRPRRRQPPALWLLRRYHPGPLLAVGVVMGFGLGLPGVFLRPFAASLGINEIALFFTVYAPTAFLMRLATRRLPQRLGIRPMILAGVSFLVVSLLLFLLVQVKWQLAIPAVAMGTAHALLFPSVVAGGSAMFPSRYRGLATTLMLAMFDLGNLVGAPTVGILLRCSEQLALPRYPTMFVSVAALFAAVAVYFILAPTPSPFAQRSIRRSGQPAASLAHEEGNNDAEPRSSSDVSPQFAGRS